MKPPLEAFDEQMDFDRESKTFTARCAVCGKAVSLKKGLFESRDKALERLRRGYLGWCEMCGKWVCDDCFCVDNGNGKGIALCTACAKEHGINGVTVEHFDEVWQFFSPKAKRFAEIIFKINGKKRMRNEQ